MIFCFNMSFETIEIKNSDETKQKNNEKRKCVKIVVLNETSKVNFSKPFFFTSKLLFKTRVRCH